MFFFLRRERDNLEDIFAEVWNKSWEGQKKE